MSVITSWQKNVADDLEMDNQHLHTWKALINTIQETDLSNKTILDYGCGPGGFLRYLYSVKPFKKGIGIDIATKSIEQAKTKINSLPIEYHLIDEQLKIDQNIDIAFSHEVLFLLPDLKVHAKFIYDCLKLGGVYYAVTGGHTENKLWPHWKTLLEQNSNLPVYDYSPENIVDSFLDNDFSGQATHLQNVGFVPIFKDRSFYPTILDVLQYSRQTMIVFRFQKAI